MHLTETFELDAREISHSRQFVSSALERSGLQASDDVLLVTSELVTNAVLHGAGQIELHVAIEAGSVHLEVYDEGGSPPAPRPMPDGTAQGGRGLPLIARLSRAWGTRLDRGRTLVWADLSAPMLGGSRSLSS